MTPEEKEKLIAETKKLQAEAASLRKGGWSKPSSWIPMLAAFAAIATSVGQFQVNAINQREAALEAREKVIEAKEEEKQLKKKNEKLEFKAKELTEKIAKSTSESLELEEEIKNANKQLLALATDRDVSPEQFEKIKRDAAERETKAESIAVAAKKRNEEAEIQNLVWQMNSDVKATRLAAVEQLINNYRNSKSAISASIDLVTMPQIESLSASGRINILVFLRNTDPSGWDDKLKSKAEFAIDEIRERAESGKAFIGPQTDEAINRFVKHIELEAHNK